MTHSSYSEMTYSSQLTGAHMAPQLDAAPLPISPAGSAGVPPPLPFPHFWWCHSKRSGLSDWRENTRGVREGAHRHFLAASRK